MCLFVFVFIIIFFMTLCMLCYYFYAHSQDCQSTMQFNITKSVIGISHVSFFMYLQKHDTSTAFSLPKHISAIYSTKLFSLKTLCVPCMQIIYEISCVTPQQQKLMIRRYNCFETNQDKIETHSEQEKKLCLSITLMQRMCSVQLKYIFI